MSARMKTIEETRRSSFETWETIEAARVATREKMCRRAAELKRRVAKKSAAAGEEVAKIRRESGIEGGITGVMMHLVNTLQTQR